MEKNEKLKQYNNRDEFINDDGMTVEEKIEVCESLLESMEIEEGEEYERN